MVAVEKAKVKASVFASEERCPDLKETALCSCGHGAHVWCRQVFLEPPFLLMLHNRYFYFYFTLGNFALHLQL